MIEFIMVPVGLAHRDALDAAVMEAGNLAKANHAKLIFVGVTGSAPSEAAHNPKEYEQKLLAYAGEVAERIGVSIDARSLVDVDVVADLGKVLVKLANDMEVDLIVMASHVPGFIDHIFSSNAGYVASHAKCSVYVAR